MNVLWTFITRVGLGLLGVWLFNFILIYARKINMIQHIMGELYCTNLQDIWLNNVLIDYNLTGLRVLIFQEGSTRSAYPSYLGPASAIALPFRTNNSVIFLSQQIVNDPRFSMHFILAHEIGHIIHERSLREILLPSTEIQQEIKADAFAASIVGRRIVEENLVRLYATFGRYEYADMRIMALQMPTLFRQYA